MGKQRFEFDRLKILVLALLAVMVLPVSYTHLQGIKQEELADLLEVSRKTISSLENGRYNPSILLAFKIAKYFNLTIEEIFIYEEDQ